MRGRPPALHPVHFSWKARIRHLPVQRWGVMLGFAVVAVLAIGLLWFLYQKTQASGTAGRAGVEEQLRLIHQFDSDWNVDIMSSKIGLNDSYDPIVAPSQKIAAGLKRLQETDGAQDARVQEQIGAVGKLFSQKADLVDEFKSHNSILRNSLRFLPTAAADARSALGPSRAGAKASAAADLVNEINVTLSETLKYAVFIDDAQRDQLVAATTRLTDLAQPLADPSAEREAITVFLNHARTVLGRMTNEARLLSGIVDVPTVKSIDKAQAAFDGYFDRKTGDSEFWRKALFAYSGFLLLAAAYTAVRLRQSYRQINRMNAALVKANDGLEQRVQERTRDLGNALNSLRESEVQLIQSEKMSSLGQMIAGVVHEINTPLAYVRSSVETVDAQLVEVSDLVRHSNAMLSAMVAPEPDPDKLSECFAALSAITSSFSDHAIAEELRKLAHDSIHGLDQISEIVVNLRNFSRLDRSKTTRFDLREGIDSTLVIARSTIRAHEIRKNYSDIPAIMCAPSQLNQVFLNLITNAAQALPAEGGVITLSTSVDEDMVRVDIADNGSGIDPEHIQKIFDPFFTTKDIGKGTGLGLSIVYKIIQEHGGRITVQSPPGVGTTFSIYLPTSLPAQVEPGQKS